MKNGTKILIGLLLLFSLACGGARPTQTPATTSGTVEVSSGTVEVGSGTVEPGGAVKPEDDAPGKFSVDPQAMDRLSSYRGRISWVFEDATGMSQELFMEIKATREPKAQELSIDVEGESIGYIIIGNEYWLGFGGEWSKITVDNPEELLGEFDAFLLDQEGLLSDVDDTNYEYLGKEQVNGINCHHYHLKYDSMSDLLGMDSGEIRAAEADVWIADEPGLPEMLVRFTMKAEGAMEGEEGRFNVTFDIYEVNNPSIVIEPPANASGGLPADVPEYPNASDYAGFGGMITFSTEDDLATVHEFYKENLPATGWELTDSMNFDELVMETWEKDGQQFQLTITTNEGEDTSVLIIIGE